MRLHNSWHLGGWIGISRWKNRNRQAQATILVRPWVLFYVQSVRFTIVLVQLGVNIMLGSFSTESLAHSLSRTIPTASVHVALWRWWWWRAHTSPFCCTLPSTLYLSVSFSLALLLRAFVCSLLSLSSLAAKPRRSAIRIYRVVLLHLVGS